MERLPTESLEQIFSLLPFPCVVQARLVCKQWLSLLTSPPFFHLWASRSQPSFWLLFSGLKGTHALSVRQHLCCTLAVHDPSNNTIAASCHGVFLSVSSSSPPLCSLFNPLTKRVLTLPPPTHTQQFLSLAIHADPSFSSFHVVSCGLSSSLQMQNPPAHPQYLDGRFIVTELYDSASASWLLLPPSRLRPQLRHGKYPDVTILTQDFVWWNGSLCILSTTHIMTYDLQSSEWGFIELPKSQYKWRHLQLTLHVIKDRLFLEGLFAKRGHVHDINIVGVVELNHISKEWMEMFLMPSQYRCRLYGAYTHDRYISYSDADYDHILFSPYGSRNQEAVVLFHVDTGAWTCEIVSHGVHRDYYHSSDMKGLMYRPNLLSIHVLRGEWDYLMTLSLCWACEFWRERVLEARSHPQNFLHLQHHTPMVRVHSSTVRVSHL